MLDDDFGGGLEYTQWAGEAWGALDMLEWVQIAGGENKWRLVDGINAWYVAIRTHLEDLPSSNPFVERRPLQQPLDFPNDL